MYSKIGLGLLAAAGLTFGVIGMQTGGASPAPPVCTNDGGGSSGNGGASAAGNGNGTNNPSATDNGTGSEGTGNGLGGGNGAGNGSGNGSDGGGSNGPATTPTTTGNNGNPSTRATADNRFLVLHGHTDETDVVDGTATVPETNTGVTGRSRILSHLIRIDADGIG